MPVSTWDIAKAADVSRTTASHVLNGRTDVPISAATRERVLAVVRKLGYRPNALARSLRNGRTHLIEVWVHSFFPSFFAQGIQALQDVVRETQYSLHLIQRPAWAGGPGRANDAEAWPVDGILAFDADVRGEWLERVRAHGVPFVDVSNFGPVETDWVGVDLRAGGRIATRHLLETGRHRVVFLAPEDVPEDARLLGYQETMREAGFTPQEMILRAPRPRYVGCLSDCENTRREIGPWVRAHGMPEAFFCFNDECALGAIRGLHDAGIRVPEDTAVVGCDDIAVSAQSVPSLTTLRYPYAEVARLAWEFLRKRIEAPKTPRQQKLLTPELIVRESSATCRSEKRAKGKRTRGTLPVGS
jgi:DNA-binding LacI/PurR family transcriptional regulator